MLHGLVPKVRMGGTIPSVPLVPLWHACGQLYVCISGFNKNCEQCFGVVNL